MSMGAAAESAPGQMEFGLSERELVRRVEKVEELISACMREQGFEYVAVDFQTIYRSMEADKVLPGLDEEQFIARYGFGIATLYTGKPPQLATGYSPAKMGFGRENVAIFQGLSPADQVAYTRALSGGNADATFAIGLDSEDFSRCGGCTLDAIEKVFEAEALSASYYNPTDALIAKDRRMRAALSEYATRMRAAGLDVDNPDLLEADVRERLDAITGGASIPLERFSPEQLEALEELKTYEIRLATTSFRLEEKLLDPIEEKVEKELFARRVD
ncbi:MAG: hypothetical protein K8E66_00985, partial [Phycisphaerales bacterium]|nr:hypothetical protein [Phycisphaerales bacterium]